MGRLLTGHLPTPILLESCGFETLEDAIKDSQLFLECLEHYSYVPCTEIVIYENGKHIENWGDDLIWIRMIYTQYI